MTTTHPTDTVIDRVTAFERARHLLPEAGFDEQLRLADWMAAGDDKFSAARVERVARELCGIFDWSYLPNKQEACWLCLLSDSGISRHCPLNPQKLFISERGQSMSVCSQPGWPCVEYTVDAVILADHNNQLSVLLVRRGRKEIFAGCYALPGGYVDSGETGLAAAYRELKEETGLVLTDHDGQLKLIGIFDDPARDPRGRVISAAYTTRLTASATVVGGDDTDHATWQPLSDALRMTLAFDHDQILRAALTLHGLGHDH